MNSISKTLFSLVHQHGFAVGMFATIFSFCFFAGGLVVANGQTVEPLDSRVVTLYEDGQARDIPTRARTVDDFLKKADVTMHEGDLAEPSLDTPIEGDSFRVNIYRARPVMIVDGQKQTRVLSPHASARVIAEKAGVQTYAEDILTLTQPESIVDEKVIGEKLIVERATPVTLSLYGAPAVPIRTHTKTVGDLLDERGITPEQGATVVPAVDTPLTQNLPIFISKFGKKVVSVEETIAFPVETVNDPTMAQGTTKITSTGKPGKKQVTYEIELRDNRETGRRVLQEAVIEEPVKQVVARGTKSVVITGEPSDWMRAAGIAESDFYYVNFIVGHEAGWNGTTKWNKAGSGAYGLCQALPASKMASAGADYMTNPVTQLKWCNSYAVGRYGSWAKAYTFWTVNSWW